MRVIIITDLEGVNGVLNFPDWCVPEGARNEVGCRFLTEEVNAAVAGFYDGGATEVIVVDGHGAGGSIRGEMLDGRASLQRGAKCFLTFNDNADVAAFVGQHAKAGTPNAHLAHTQTQAAVDFRINGVSLGEFGQLSYGFFEKQIPVIFASGDLALTREARELIPGIFTSAVKEGFNEALDGTCPTEQVMSRQSSALHYPRTKVLADIRKQASCAMAQYLSRKESFRIKPLEGPYVAEAEYRATAPKDIPVLGDLPPRRITTGVHETVAGAFEEFYSTLEWAVPVEGEHFHLL